MTTIKLGNKEYRIKYGYEATMRSGILKKLAQLSNAHGATAQIEATAEILPELLVVGLQKYHSDEFGFDYTTGEGKDEQIDRAYKLLDDYFDEEDADFEYLLGKLQTELMENGFLARLLQKEQSKAKKSTSKDTAEVVPIKKEN